MRREATDGGLAWGACVGRGRRRAPHLQAGVASLERPVVGRWAVAAAVVAVAAAAAAAAGSRRGCRVAGSAAAMVVPPAAPPPTAAVAVAAEAAPAAAAAAAPRHRVHAPASLSPPCRCADARGAPLCLAPAPARSLRRGGSPAARGAPAAPAATPAECRVGCATPRRGSAGAAASHCCGPCCGPWRLRTAGRPSAPTAPAELRRRGGVRGELPPDGGVGNLRASLGLWRRYHLSAGGWEGPGEVVVLGEAPG